ncbi:MAG TPA: hypothetical protein VIJ33_10265, partial [Solirubrobacteraceae bacterium]
EHDGSTQLVGGAVRDIMLGAAPRELDVVVEGDTSSFVTALARRLSTLAGEDSQERCEVTSHERFKTALVRWESGEIDVAMRRTETYRSPGALPDVAAGTPEQDLLRRDFTVNAIAVTLAGVGRAAVQAFAGALEDLEAGRLRVLHEASFHDDPTRLLRLARYSTRLSFTVEDHTLQLANQAVSSRALDTVSGARIGAELRLALSEEDALGALAAMDELSLLSALHPGLCFKDDLARAALGLLPLDAHGDGDGRGKRVFAKPARGDLLLLAVLLQPMVFGMENGIEDTAYTLLDDLEFPVADRELVLQAAIHADAVAEELNNAEVPSEVHDTVSHLSAEGIALAGAWAGLEWGPLSQAAEMARLWFSDIRHVALQITGEDLIAAGVPEGPEVGERLRSAHAMLLDGLIEPGREPELRAALEAKT